MTSSDRAQLPTLILISPRDELASFLVARLASESLRCILVDAEKTSDRNRISEISQDRPTAAVFRFRQDASLHFDPPIESVPDLFRIRSRLGLDHAILLSSTSVYVPHHHNPGFVDESFSIQRNSNEVARSWAGLEALFLEEDGDRDTSITTVLRIPILAGGCDAAALSRELSPGRAWVPAGFDPALQILSWRDLAAAIESVLERRAGGLFNLVPDGVIPLRKALRMTGARRTPVPTPILRASGRLFGTAGARKHRDRLDYFRHSWTSSGSALHREVGFQARDSSVDALNESMKTEGRQGEVLRADFDPYGMDREYIRAYGKHLFRFLHTFYWRVELQGLEHLPRSGPGVLVGVHRGFMPWDAVMLLHGIVEGIGRYPRFLIHPCLVKFPWLANYIIKLGGLIASRENAEFVLRQGGLLGVFPEGIQGAFRRYKCVYEIGRFSSDEFVRTAIRHGVPLLPVVTVGSAEIFPIFGRINWRWLRRLTEWPFFPVTAPFPLPSKWHTQFLPPIHIEQEYPPKAAQDRRLVRRIALDVRKQLQQAISELAARRRSIFFGSIFEGPGSEPQSHEGAKRETPGRESAQP